MSNWRDDETECFMCGREISEPPMKLEGNLFCGSVCLHYFKYATKEEYLDSLKKETVAKNGFGNKL